MPMENTQRLHVVENNPLKDGQKPVKRLKARHLSALTKVKICTTFAALLSFDDTITEMDIPGLTRSVVSEVLHSMHIRKAAASECALSAVPFRKVGGAR